jgi:DNA-binding winged helix-turn-helix (wHTH) protein
LRDLNNHDNVIILNSPASRCLLLLIERIGSIVTQQEFLDIVWTKCGMQVSTNTFYQNISILRKGLKKRALMKSWW